MKYLSNFWLFLPRVMRTNHTKVGMTGDLNEYLRHLSRGEHAKFVKDVCKVYDCKRTTFYNWKHMCCRIPDAAKDVIEDIAGCYIFKDRKRP